MKISLMTGLGPNTRRPVRPKKVHGRNIRNLRAVRSVRLAVALLRAQGRRQAASRAPDLVRKQVQRWVPLAARRLQSRCQLVQLWEVLRAPSAVRRLLGTCRIGSSTSWACLIGSNAPPMKNNTLTPGWLVTLLRTCLHSIRPARLPRCSAVSERLLAEVQKLHRKN